MTSASPSRLPSITAAIDDARREAERYAENDPAYAETMATYVELGELLETNRTDREFEEECRALAFRLLSLEKVMQDEFDQQWALWCARNMRPLKGE